MTLRTLWRTFKGEYTARINQGFQTEDGYRYPLHVEVLFICLALLPLHIASGRSKPVRALAVAIALPWFLAVWAVGAVAFVPGALLEAICEGYRAVWRSTE